MLPTEPTRHGTRMWLLCSLMLSLLLFLIHVHVKHWMIWRVLRKIWETTPPGRTWWVHGHIIIMWAVLELLITMQSLTFKYIFLYLCMYVSISIYINCSKKVWNITFALNFCAYFFIIFTCITKEMPLVSPLIYWTQDVSQQTRESLWKKRLSRLECFQEVW